MRPLLVLSVLLPCSLSLDNEGHPSEHPRPPGGIRLLEGFRHKTLQGIDSSIGRIWKEGGLQIEYDIGGNAGNGAGSVKGVQRMWAISQVVNGQKVEVAKARDGRVVATFITKPNRLTHYANFSMKPSGEEDVAAFMAIVLTYIAPPDDH